MPAHRRAIIVHTCGKFGCTKKATHVVMTTRNEQVGAFCEHHSIALVNQLQRQDEEEAQRAEKHDHTDR